MAAHAKGLAGELGQAVPDAVPFIGAGKRDAGLDALLVGGRARRIVAAQADAPDRNVFVIQIISCFYPVDHRACRALIVAANRDLVLRLALPRPVDRQHRDATRKEWLLVGMDLLL